MVGFHVVNYEVVYWSLTNHLLDVLDKLCEEVHLDGVNEHHLVVVDKI